jgi:ABC-type lipoprotein release transport system permease subunit
MDRAFTYPRPSLLVSVRLGLFLALRQIQRGNIWTLILTIFVMTLTFLNLVFIGGILVGLITSSADANRTLYTSDIIVSALDRRPYIEDTPGIVAIAHALPWVSQVSTRYTGSARIEAGYRERTNYTDIANEANAQIAGIDPAQENSVSGLSRKVVAGRYLNGGDAEGILLGANLLYQFSPIDAPGLRTLKNVHVGDKVRVTVAGRTKELVVLGILKSKVAQVDQRAFVISSTLRDLLGRTDSSVNEIVIKLSSPDDADVAKQALIASGVAEHAKVQTWVDAEPKAIKDIAGTFALLGNIVGSIGLVVAAITIFIVIFISAITRRKFIGILRGLGVGELAIEISYVAQALFYALVGTTIGILILYLVLQPYFVSHPINFPFSDGVLVATALGTAVRAALLILASVIAGYIPVRIVLSGNTLDAILGR